MATQIEIDQATVLPTLSLAELLTGRRPGQAIIVPEMYVEAKEHPCSVPPADPALVSKYASHSFRAPEMTLELLFDQYWFPESGFLLSRDGKAWRHSVLGQYGDPHFLTTYAVQDQKNEDGTITYIFHQHLLDDVPVIENLVLVSSHYASHNFGHFMLDMVPLIQFALTNKIDLISRPLLPWQESLYRAIGSDPAKVKIVTERAVLLRKVLISNRHNAVSTYAASPHHRGVFEAIHQNIKSSLPAPSKENKVFLSRGPVRSRMLRNRAELEQTLKVEGFAVIRPEQLSFTEQVSIFQGADIIVSEFGALLANVVFCRPGTTVIEIIPDGQNDPWSRHLCASMGLPHVTLFHPVDDNDRESIEFGGRVHSNIYFSFDANITKVLEVVRQVTREKGMSHRHKYEYDVDLKGRTAPAEVVDLVGISKQVLEIGSGPGSITKILSGVNDCRVTALEIDSAAIEKVRPYCDNVIQADLNSPEWPELLAGMGPFEVLVAADVLEHLYDPWSALQRMRRLIGPQGYLVISLPHVGHAAVMGCLMSGNFEYRDWGLLDRTHIRFFGLKNIDDLFSQAKLKIIEVRFVCKSPEDSEFSVIWSGLSENIKAALRTSPHWNVYQVVVKAVPIEFAGEAISLAPVKSGAPQSELPQSTRSRIAAKISPAAKGRIRTALSVLGIKL